MDGGAQEILEVRDAVSFLRRRARLIVLTVAITLGLAFLFLVGTTPLYTATTLLLVDPAQKNLLQPSSDGTMNAALASSLIESEVEILLSDTVLLATIRDAKLISDPEFGPSLSILDRLRQAAGIGAGGAPDGEAMVNTSLARLRDALGARRRGLTNLIEISLTAENPARAAALANRLADTYIRLQVSAKAESFLNARDVIEAQLSDAQRALAETDTALAGYFETNLDRLERESGSAAVAALRQQLEQADAEQRAARQAADAAARALVAQDWAALVSDLDSDALAALQSQRESLARRLGQSEAGTEAAVDLRAGLAGVDAQLARAGETALAALHAEVAGYETAGERIRDELRRTLLAGDLSTETLMQIYGLQQEAAIAQRQYDTMLTRMRDLEAQAMLQVADSRVVSEAIAPADPSFPNAGRILVLALASSLGLGVGLAFISEYYIGGIHSTHQLANVIPAKVGSVLPKVSHSAEQRSAADTVVDAPMSHYAESLRRLRANVDRFSASGDGTSRIIMVTSAIPAEGKSVTALALARTYAAAGKRTLLIDADMRKPAQNELLGVEPASGLFEYLAQTDDPQASDCYARDPRSRVGVIFGRQRSATPTDQPIQSEAFRRLIEDARQSFDVILIDTPPLSPVVDARYVAPLADCAVLCVRTGETSQADLRAAYEQLTDHAAPTTAVISALTFHPRTENDAHYSGLYD